MSEIAKRYDEAVQSFVDKVKLDPNVIAVLVYGSVAHGTVWEKSDIDITVVVRDQKLDRTNYGIYEDNLLLCVQLTPRSGLKRWMEKDIGGLFGHGINATTKIAYTTDDSLYGYLEENRSIGRGDADKAIFSNVNWMLGLMEKVEKWLAVKKDPSYARFYLLKTAEVMAQIEISSRLIVPTREAILQARDTNPAFVEKYYDRPMAGDMTEEEIYTLLKKPAACRAVPAAGGNCEV